MESECGWLRPPITQTRHHGLESFEAMPPRRVARKRFVKGHLLPGAQPDRPQNALRSWRESRKPE